MKSFSVFSATSKLSISITLLFLVLLSSSIAKPMVSTTQKQSFSTNLQAANKSKISPVIIQRIKQIASQDLGVPANKLRIKDSIKYQFTNSCLDILGKCQNNRESNINGWKVLVDNSTDETRFSHRSIYHLDQFANKVVAGCV
jgi:hypothetical protein